MFLKRSLPINRDWLRRLFEHQWDDAGTPTRSNWRSWSTAQRNLSFRGELADFIEKNSCRVRQLKNDLVDAAARQ